MQPNKPQPQPQIRNKTPERARVTPVAKTRAKQKPFIQRLLTNIIKTDAHTLMQRMQTEFLEPFIANAAIGAVRIIFQGTDATKKQTNTSEQKVRYNQFINSSVPVTQNSRYYSEQSSVSFDDFETYSHESARAILDRLNEILATNNVVRVGDYYDVCGQNPPHTAWDYGWSDLRRARIIQHGDMWQIKMPAAYQIAND